MRPVEKLLQRLERVRGTSPRWRSLCPAHDNKRTLTLAIYEADDGRVLIKCHAGCSALDVMEAVGMKLRDLFPDALGHYIPSKRRKFREAEAEYGIQGARNLREKLSEAKQEIKKLRGNRG